ncbi:MAG: hypothetical protein J2P53_02535 [Bradyrhizobiaceae bacterium]|nr:hypothetical protein [Bradyrhizobiaceae bacterium]
MLLLTHRLKRCDPPARQQRAGQDRVIRMGLDVTLRLLVVAFVLSLAAAADTSARDYGQYGDTDPAIKDWVKRLTDKTGQGCCATADGHPAEYEWDTAGNHYRVRIEGEWYDVPAEAVIEEPNRLGYATVWYWWDWSLDGKKTHHIRCFLPGPGG